MSAAPISSPRPLARVQADPMARAAGKVPPHDLDAEAAVLSTLLLDVRRLSQVQLRAADFYSEPNGRIYSAIVELAADERAVDTVTVAGLLRDRQRLASIGGPAYLAQIVDATPSVANVGAHAERVATLARRRRVIDRAHRIAAEGYGDVPEGWEQDAARAIADVAGPMVETKPDLALADVDALFAPLPPVPWLVQSLDMCPGAPTLFAGYGFSGKTIAAQSLALSVAAGGPVWGSVSLARRGRVIHVDYEQGLRLTAERYQRLARARDITADELRGRLAVAALPAMHLSAAGAIDAYSRACEGAALLIVDSLRACAPDLDENSSEVRRLLDALLAVSERTGVVPLVIHHARKPRDDDGGGSQDRDPRLVCHLRRLRQRARVPGREG
ncbi:MAG: AAA family ATPase [Polyangiaceae bacterium]|nr:AAA family ATPase [Polyangiaceae bacterium]